MKHSKKGYLLVIMLLTLALLSTGCKKKTSQVDESTDVNNDQTIEMEDDTETADESADESADEDSESDSDSESKDEESTEIDIYGINEESLESEPSHAVIKGEVTAKSIVQAVVDDYIAKSIEIGIYDVTQEDSTVIVSFEYGKAPLANVGSDVEETILNCISDSLMDNLDSCEAVIFRAEDGSYESGHFAFDYDEVYASE